MKDINILHTEEEYEAALSEFEGYFDNEPVPGTPDADRFELLGILIAKYEDEHHPIPEGTPVEVLRAFMEANGKSQSDLAELLGSRPRASELLSGRREINLSQIRLLAREWRIPAAALIGQLELV